MGSVAHVHQAHLSHGSHHHSHHPAVLAEYEGRYHVGSISQVPSPAIITEADRKRATLCEAQATLQLAPLSAIRRVHDQSHRHLRGQSYNYTERTAGQGRDTPHAQVAQERAGCPTQPPDVDRLTSVSAFLTPPSADDARQAVTDPKISGCGLSLTLSTPPNTASYLAAVPGAHFAVDSAKHQPTMSIAEKDSLSMVVHSPEVPRCISSKGGSISDFTAEMTCLFWFEPPSAYLQSENLESMSPRSRLPRLSENAIPGVNFRSWVNRIISTTQVTQNVILLALLFIYRLKSLNVVVRGKAGSEFRLLTVALMLGNKFLDDNTYTNKTWSDVSGLHVKEIHVMEVEFLSNMRYGLLVSKEEWEALVTAATTYITSIISDDVSPPIGNEHRQFISYVIHGRLSDAVLFSYDVSSGIRTCYCSNTASRLAR
ncbi:hypothetical protein SEPCBS57363_003340 [Sporothrix epigloea]|uniref:Uncharacterized protein n=1 Tax=Sporothrix epigloea TaxID=1892477 RepID=A0ABP0DKW2_9PEZI